MVISFPSLCRKTRETAQAVPVSTVSASLTPGPSSRARTHQSPQPRDVEREPKGRLEDTSGHQVRVQVVDDHQLRTSLGADHQHQVQEWRRPSRERQPAQSAVDERLKQHLPQQHEGHQRSGRGDPQPRLGGHQRSGGRQLPEKTPNTHLQHESRQAPREHPRSQTSLELSVDERQRRQMRQSHERETQEPQERERQPRQGTPQTQEQQSLLMEGQSRARRQQVSDQSQRGRLPNYRDAAPQSLYTTQAPQTRMQHLNAPRHQNQSRNQAERIQFLPRAPQREAGLEARERAGMSNRQPRQQVLEQDETQVRRRIRSQEQARESSQRDSSNWERSERRLYTEARV
jgi:hypothetical protein